MSLHLSACSRTMSSKIHQNGSQQHALKICLKRWRVVQLIVIVTHQHNLEVMYFLFVETLVNKAFKLAL